VDSSKFKIKLAFDPTVTHLDIYPKKIKSTHKSNTWITMFFSSNSQVMDIYICTMEYYLTVKKNVIMSFAGRWMEL
jgi:hypothetical protein